MHDKKIFKYLPVDEYALFLLNNEIISSGCSHFLGISFVLSSPEPLLKGNMSVHSKTIEDGTVAIIEIKGSFIGDGDTDQLRHDVDDFVEQGNKRLILDLHKVNYMNSSGIGAMIHAHTHFVKAGGQMKLVGITQNIQNLFTITRLVEIFDVYDTLDEAVMSFSNQEIIKQ